MPTTVGQFCIYVSDIKRSEQFYTEFFDLKVQSRTEIDNVHEIVLAADKGGGRLQLAERYLDGQPVDHGFAALWKFYLNVDDCKGTHDRIVAAGHTSTMEPERLDRWPVIVGFVNDPDGYSIELIQFVDGAKAPGT